MFRGEFGHLVHMRRRRGVGHRQDGAHQQRRGVLVPGERLIGGGNRRMSRVIKVSEFFLVAQLFLVLVVALHVDRILVVVLGHQHVVVVMVVDLVERVVLIMNGSGVTSAAAVEFLLCPLYRRL